MNKQELIELLHRKELERQEQFKTIQAQERLIKILQTENNLLREYVGLEKKELKTIGVIIPFTKRHL